MITLIALTVRELAGLWPTTFAIAWILLAALLSSETGLGSGSLGEYLALAELVPVVLLFRSAALVERRRSEGWDLEEGLRNPGGWRLPAAELGGAALLLAGVWTLTALPPHAPRLALGTDAGLSRHPARVAEDAPGIWRARFPAPAPTGSVLELVASWESAQGDEALLGAGDGRTITLAPGLPARWELSAEEARSGVVELRLEGAAGVVAIEGLSRLAVPRPGRSALPGLVGGLFLFHLTLFSLALFSVRVLRVRSSLAALAALGVGALSLWPRALPVPATGSPTEWLARLGGRIAALLPPVGGLHAVGVNYELRYDTTSAGAVALWLLLGAVLLAASTRPWKTAS